MNQPILDDTDDRAFAVFARLYPHEAHATWPQRFMEFMRKERPGITAEEVERALAETEGDDQ